MADKAHRFDQFISALAGAVVDAQYIAHQAQLSDLQKFFRERDPKEVEIEVKKAIIEAENAYKEATAAEGEVRKIRNELETAKKEGKKDEVEVIKAKLDAMKAKAEALKAAAEAKKAEAEAKKAEAQFKHYSPKTVFISFQSTRPSAKLGEMDTVPVPLITLVKPVQHSIDEMLVSTHVEIGEIKETKGKEDDWSTSEGKTTIYVSTTSGKQSEAIGTAQVTLKIKAEEPQEGLARLIDNLYKVL